MSYILEAIKKAEREREIIQYIDYNDKLSYQVPAWHRICNTYIPIMVFITMLLWPQLPLMPKQTNIVKPTIYQSTTLYGVYNNTPMSFDKKRSRRLIDYEN